MQLFDFAVAVMFLLSLIAVSRFRRYLSAEDKTSYNHILAGLSILAVSSLAQVYNGIGLFGMVPFLAEEMFFRLIFWIGMITGLAFLIEGVTTWVPLSRSYRKYNKERIARLEFIKQVEQLVRVESRIPVVFSTTLQYALEKYNLAAGDAYMLSRKDRRIIRVASLQHFDDDIPELPSLPYDFFAQTTREQDGAFNSEVLPIESERATIRPHLMVPVWAANELAGFFAIWTKPTAPLPDEDRMNLKLAGDIIGNVICKEMLRLRYDFLDSISAWRRRLSSQMDYNGEPKDNILVLAGRLKKKVNHDYFSLTIVCERSHAQRYTLGDNDSLLAEPNVDIGKTSSMVADVLEHGRPILVPDLKHESADAVDEVIKRGGYRSIHVMPVKKGVTVTGVLTIASRSPLRLTRSANAYVEAALDVIGDLAAEQRHRHRINVLQRRSYLVNKFLGGVTRTESVPDVLKKAVSLIFSELKPGVVRLSIADAEGTFLNSKALEMTRTDQAVTPEQGTMILSLMPYHQLVLDTGRLMMINQERTERKMTEAEAKQVFGTNISSALIVPVKVGTSIVGVISLGEKRSWSRFRFGQSEIQFVTAIAMAVAMSLRAGQRTPKKELAIPEPKPATESGDLQTRSRIKSSLSGIIGSIELLKATGQTDDNNLEKCLTIIDKSARRISEYISGETT